MAIIWQSSWFWVMLSAVLLLMLGSIVIKLNTPQIQTESTQITYETVAIPSYYVSPDILDPYTLPLQLTIDQDNRRTPSFYSDIAISRPDCYDLANGEYTCLGQIQNNSDNLLGDTSINLQFYDEFGAKLAQETIAIEQRLIPSQSSAPYRVTVNPIDSQTLDNASTIATINRTLPPTQNLRSLSVASDYETFIQNGRYHITLSIENNSGYLANNIRLFTTLTNTEWGIVGYDVHEVEQIVENGANQVIQLNIIPFVIASDIEVIFHAEADIQQ
ncbi:MAG: hypothetical protein Phog2KO_40660 [Phototrophicaceae bacterium]